jgi:hypothetical protein
MEVDIDNKFLNTNNSTDVNLENVDLLKDKDNNINSNIEVLNNSEDNEKNCTDNNIISENISSLKVKFCEANFSVNDKSQVFYTGYLDSKSEEESSKNNNKVSNYERTIDLSKALIEINNLKIESANYLQKVMESNENLGATLSKVKEVEFEEE